MRNTFIAEWLIGETPEGVPENVVVLAEQKGQRAFVEKAIQNCVIDHLVGAEIVELIGGFTKAANVIRNSLPVSKRARSGDFGEVLATEYVDQATSFAVPIRRLRYKDDRAMSMRGDDVLAFAIAPPPTKVMKVESKSRASLSPSVAKEACDGLCRFNGRPNPSTLSFVSRRLRERGEHDLAALIELLQETDVGVNALHHLIFTVSGNNPVTALSSVSESPVEGIARQVVGCHIEDHAAFIQGVFDGALKGGSSRGDS